jgi:hypothetical protein
MILSHFLLPPITSETGDTILSYYLFIWMIAPISVLTHILNGIQLLEDFFPKTYWLYGSDYRFFKNR